METNTCDVIVNHLGADALLPPRKRLLAGLKRQNSDVNFPVSPTPSSFESEFDARLNNLLRSRLSNPNLSNEGIVEASRCAAIEAAKVAAAARANAEEKAAKAAKAVAAAKNALDFVAILSEEAKKEKSLKKNKMKKHMPVQVLYNKSKGNTNCGTDEELARKLHRDINSSPRIMKNSSVSDTKNHKHKRLKSNGTGVVGEVDLEGPVKEIDMIMVDLNTSKPDSSDQARADCVEMENFEMVVPSKDKVAESLDNFGKKRGRIKQKKLPLSICSFRDQTEPRGTLQSDDNASKTAASNEPALPEGSSSGNSSLVPVERRSMWKCQAFKAPPTCVAQSKVMQS